MRSVCLKCTVPDPHMPNMQAGYCRGGGMGSQISLAYCDGVPFPDGSYWHTIQYGAPEFFKVDESSGC